MPEFIQKGSESIGVFDWDDTIQHDSEFISLPDGEYPFEVTAMERGYHPGSGKLPACNKAVLTLRVDGGELGTTTIKHNLFLTTKTEGLICDFFSAISARKRGEKLVMDWDAVVGRRGRCNIFIDRYTKKDGTPGENNKVRSFVIPKPAPADAPQGAAGKKYAKGEF